MASILSVTSILFLVALTRIASAANDDYSSDAADRFLSLSPRAGSRLLQDQIKKGQRCNTGEGNICPGPPGVPAKNGTQLLTCCKNNCRNTLTDRNNCGGCGNKCAFGRLCCNSVCTVVAYDVRNCGKCGSACKSGVRCEYGNCGYA